MKPLTTTSRRIVDALLAGYRRGYFPMAESAPPWDPTGPAQIYWPSPDPRGVLPLTREDGFHAPRRLERRLAHRPFTIRSDTKFEQVMRSCALPRQTTDPQDDGGTWIDETLVAWFRMLHEREHAHSVEALRRDPATGADGSRSSWRSRPS